MKKSCFGMMVLVLLASLVAIPVAAAPAPVLMTLHMPDPDLVVRVMASNGKCTTFWSRPFAIVRDVGPGPYLVSGGNTHSKDLLVLDMGKKLVASSYWPGAPYTEHQVYVETAGEYWVMEQVVPQPNSNVQISDPGPGKMTLGIPDPENVVVVRAGVKPGFEYYTFYSRPAGVTESVIPGPYIFNGVDTKKWNLLVFDLNKVLVASSWWPGEPFTQYRATVQNAGAYFVLGQYVPSNVPQ